MLEGYSKTTMAQKFYVALFKIEIETCRIATNCKTKN